MRPWNPYSQTFHGAAITGVVPTGLFVHGPPMSPRTAAMAQAAFTSFCTRARLSIVQNSQEHGRLPDGSAFQISVISGQARMIVWTLAPSALKGPTNLLHGVLRLNDYVEQPPGTWLYDEFHEVGTSDYVLSSKFLDLQGLFVLRTNAWQGFNRRELSGPAAKLAQFGRGAVAVYLEYFRRKNLPPTTPCILGDGVFVLGAGDDLRAYCYESRNDGIYTCEMELVSTEGLIVGKLPAEINALFGGKLPIPPSDTDWAARQRRVLTSTDLSTASGLVSARYVGAFTDMGSSGSARGCDLRFPRFASAGKGVEVYSLAVGGRGGDPRLTWSTLLKIIFTRVMAGAGYEVRATVASDSETGAIAYGMSNVVNGTPVGIHQGVCGVTHYQGQLTLFRRRIHVVEFSLGPGMGTRTERLNDVVTISGGYSRECLVWEFRDGREQITGNTSYLYKTVNQGEYTEREADGSYRIFVMLARHIDISSRVTRVLAGSERTLLRSFGVEGAFMLTDVKMDPNTQRLDGNLFGTSPAGPALREFYNAITGEFWRTPDEPNGDDFQYTSVIVPIPLEMDGYLYGNSWETTSKEPPTSTRPVADPNAFAADTLDGAMQPFKPNQTWVPPAAGTYDNALPRYHYLGTRVFADGREFEIDSMSLFDEGEGGQYREDFKNYGYFMTEDPIFGIRRGDGPIDTLSYIDVYSSRLGGKDAVVAAGGVMSPRTPTPGRAISQIHTSGSMVQTSKDKDYIKLRGPTRPVFIGELP